MATVSFTLARMENPPSRAAADKIVHSRPRGASEVKTSSSSSQKTTLAAAEGEFMIWVVTVTGGNVWVKFGADPTASAGNDWLITDGQTRDFFAVAGDVAAVINA